MVTGIVGSAGVLFNDDPFPRPANGRELWDSHRTRDSGLGKAPFAILKYPAADISWKGFALMLLNCLKQVFGFLWRILRGLMQLSIKMRQGVRKSLLCRLNGIGQRQTAGSFQATSQHSENLWGRRLGVHQGRRVFHQTFQVRSIVSRSYHEARHARYEP